MNAHPPLQVRTTMRDLLALRMRHLFSAADPDFSRRATGQRCGTRTLLSGYTEWVSSCDLPITIGWDWRIHPQKHGVLWLRDALPRTNIQVMDRQGLPLKQTDNLCVLATWVDTWCWRDEVARAIA